MAIQSASDTNEQAKIRRYEEACQKGNKMAGKANRFVVRRGYGGQLCIADTTNNAMYYTLDDFDLALEWLKPHNKSKGLPTNTIRRSSIRHSDVTNSQKVGNKVEKGERWYRSAKDIFDDMSLEELKRS